MQLLRKPVGKDSDAEKSATARQEAYLKIGDGAEPGVLR